MKSVNYEYSAIRVPYTVGEAYIALHSDVTTGEDDEEVATTKKYQSSHFQFHAPAEHTINGTRYDCEVKMVFTRLEETVVLVILMQLNNDIINPFFE